MSLLHRRDRCQIRQWLREPSGLGLFDYYVTHNGQVLDNRLMANGAVMVSPMRAVLQSKEAAPGDGRARD